MVHYREAERVVEEQRAKLPSPWDTPPIVEDLKAEARKRGRWNLFLPSESGLTQLEYATLA